MDPTFRQFFFRAVLKPLPRNPHWNFWPSKYLEKHVPEAVLHSFLKQGYIQLDPDFAMHWMAAFCGGRPPYDTPEECMKHMLQPERSDANYWYKRDDLQKKGLLIQTDELVSPAAARAPLP
ncbi:MAG: hypothetical protein M3O22_04020 [Pseudomonadota bacterium]|nr:hypothetical protein [Pseudomonadota bacterium]